MSDSVKPSFLRRVFTNPQFFWLLLIALIVLLSVWWVPGDGSSITDSYSTEIPGKRAFFGAIRSQFYDEANISRSVDRLIPDDADTIVMLGPARIPSEDEWEELATYVSDGGTFLYAADPRSEDFEAKPFGISYKNSWTQPAIPSEEKPIPFSVGRMSGNQSVPWASTAELVVENSYRKDNLLIRGNSIQAVKTTYGRGHAIFVASDIVFQNRSMLDSKSQITASRLFEMSEPSYRGSEWRVYVDETLNTTGTPRVLGILFTPTFRPLSLQLLLLSILFGWWGSRRFGPAVQPRSTDRRAIVEHAQALGSMHFKVGTASHVLKSYFEYFRTVSQMPTGRIDKIAGVLAARSGVEQTEIERLLTETNNAIQNPSLGSGTAATLIQQLASIRDRMMQFGSKNE